MPGNIIVDERLGVCLDIHLCRVDVTFSLFHTNFHPSLEMAFDHTRMA